ncbi:MAG: ATP-binding protein [Chloroflexi bacterium]|nr:ATP-binding protein [Chloroflexota bacterium]
MAGGNLAADRRPLTAGTPLGDLTKAFLLGWAAWHLYTDAVILRMQRGSTRPAHIQIVFEEANKILAGLDNASSEDESGQSTAEQFANMWRDSRKYGIWLHLITQSPSLIPPGILSSCNNIFVSQLKNPRDRDLAVAALHRSEKGFVDEAWRRFLASLPVARSVAKLGYSFDRAEVEPCYIQPLLLEAQEPTDGEIGAQQMTGNRGKTSHFSRVYVDDCTSKILHILYAAYRQMSSRAYPERREA